MVAAEELEQMRIILRQAGLSPMRTYWLRCGFGTPS